MRESTRALVTGLALFVWLVSPLSAEGDPRIVGQDEISEIACGPCSLFNWLSHGNEELQGVLDRLSSGESPEKTVRRIIRTYGLKESATRPSVTRYGTHNGGVGSVNLMLMARELLGDHLESPPRLRGEYLERRGSESPRDHLARIQGWFSKSLESGVPVLFYIRGYRRGAGTAEPGVFFGHHIVITSVGSVVTSTGSGSARIAIEYVDPSGAAVAKGSLSIAGQDFTAPTYTYRLTDGRASQTKKIRSERPLLEFHSPRYGSPDSSNRRFIVAHFATFAEPEN